MIEIDLDVESASEVIDHAVDVFRATGSVVDALKAVAPEYTSAIGIDILNALAAELGDQ